MRSTTGRARSASSRPSASRSAAIAIARDCRPTAPSTRACSRRRGTELRTPLRAGASDADLVGLLQNVWRNRDDRYSEIRGRLLEHKPEGVEKPERVEMYRMGG